MRSFKHLLIELLSLLNNDYLISTANTFFFFLFYLNLRKIVLLDTKVPLRHNFNLRFNEVFIYICAILHIIEFYLTSKSHIFIASTEWYKVMKPKTKTSIITTHPTQQFLQTSGSHSLSAAKHGH